jgi:hypothetical protein
LEERASNTSPLSQLGGVSRNRREFPGTPTFDISPNAGVGRAAPIGALLPVIRIPVSKHHEYDGRAQSVETTKRLLDTHRSVASRTSSGAFLFSVLETHSTHAKDDAKAAAGTLALRGAA